MPLYTFFLQDRPESMPRFELEWFDRRAEAAAHARRLLIERSHCSSVAVTEDDIEIERLKRRSA